MRHFFLGPCALFLSGCATTSFAPPVVNLDKELHVDRTQTFFNAVCSPKPNRTRIWRDTNGALRLISNFILTYRCQADRAAEGRQFFEVPGFLIAAGAATAAAFGAPADVAIGAGAAGSALSHGKSYYAPKDKAVVLNDGLDALLCIQNEAVGIDPYTLKTLSAAQEAGGTTPETTDEGTETAGTNDDGGPEVYVSSQRQYFEMIRTALFSVERVVAQRLSASGTPFDSAGVIAEIEAIKKKQEEEAKPKDEATEGKEAKKVAPPSRPTGTGEELTEGVERQSNFLAANRSLEALSDEQVGRTAIKLRTLQPKLDKCVVRAKV